MTDESRLKISVLIADDHQMIQDMMSSLIQASPDFVVYTASDYDDTVRILRDGPNIDIVLLDVNMPGNVNGHSIKQLVDEFPNTSVVVFSGNAPYHYVSGALKDGARGYIPKSMPFKSLLNAIRLIVSGEIFVPADVQSQMLASQQNSGFGLTDDEQAVLDKLCDGSSNKDISEGLNITEIKVKMHLRAICRKMNAKNRTHAVIIALRAQNPRRAVTQ